MKKFKSFKIIIVTNLMLALMPISSVVSAQENIGKIKAESGIVMDMDTGEVIASKNADKKMPVASTIKLLTSLIYAENTSKSEMISFTEDSLKTTITALNNFKKISPGDKISSDDLMEAVMILSANDAAYLMADSVAGNTQDFMKIMNNRVKSMGLKNTSLVNPCGLESDALNPENKEINISTAYDMAVIAKEAYKNEWVRETISEKNKEVTVDLAGSPVIIETRNKILGEDGNTGGKTGNETKSGRCFVGFFERDGRNLVTVALNSVYGVHDVDVFNDTKIIADSGYSAKQRVFKKAGEVIDTVELEYRPFGLFGDEKSIEAPIVATQDLRYYKNEINDKNVKIEYNSEDKSAWKLANDEVEVTFSLPNHKEQIAGKVDISVFDLLKENVGIYVIAILVVGGGIALVLVIRKKVMTSRRHKRKRNMFYKR